MQFNEVAEIAYVNLLYVPNVTVFKLGNNEWDLIAIYL